MSSGQKIAKTAINRRTQTPLMLWIKSKLFAVYRQDVTPPPGPYTKDGKCFYRDPNRYADEMSAKDQPPPRLPPGGNHSLSDVHYFGRDARGAVKPPIVVYNSAAKDTKFLSTSGEAIDREEVISVNKGPDSNFGLEAPTPGFGLTWVRNKETELPTQKESKVFPYLEKFDRYLKSN